MRRVVSLVAAGLLAGATAGCGAEVGSAALIGAASISTETIQASGKALVAEAGTTLVPGLGEIAVQVVNERTLLTFGIWHELLVQSGLASSLSSGQLQQIITNGGGADAVARQLNATPDTLDNRVVDTAALHRLVSAAAQSGVPISAPSVTVEYLYEPDLVTALANRTTFLADPEAMTAAVSAAEVGQQGGTGTVSALGAGSDLISIGLFSAEPGQIVVSDAGTQTLLARVVERTVTAEPLDPASLGQLSTSQINAIGAMILTQQVAELPAVQVNPRFGTWDPALLQVVAGANQL